MEESSWLDTETVSPSLTKMEEDYDEKKINRNKTTQEIETEKTEVLYQTYLEKARRTDLSFFSNLNVVTLNGFFFFIFNYFFLFFIFYFFVFYFILFFVFYLYFIF